MVEILPYQGYKDELKPQDEARWARENPSMCKGWFQFALGVANGAGTCERCKQAVRVDVNGQPVKHEKVAYRTAAQRGGALERVPL